MSDEKCCVCDCRLTAVRTTVRRADGTVRFEMCTACFDRRFCAMCLVFFSSAKGRQEHQCPN
jgi:hypothetical protein